jgi:flagellar hook protein FlgE
MLDSIFIGMTGLNGFSKGLKVIANNTSNMNTPGFKSSTVQFTNLYYGQDSDGNLGQGQAAFGHGLGGLSTSINFATGELRQSGNPLDLALDGGGFFTLKMKDGSFRYTRAGSFSFNADGVLIEKSSGAEVMARSDKGELGRISVDGMRTNPAKATTAVTFSGNLYTGTTEQTVSGVKVIDMAGGEHNLSAKFTADATPAGSWTVTLSDAGVTVGTAKLVFAGGTPNAASQKLNFTYTPPGLSPMVVSLAFGTDVTSYADGTRSTLTVAKQDGYSVGTLTGVSFDAGGQVVMNYTNGQQVKGSRLQLARFQSDDAVVAEGDRLFASTNDNAWITGYAQQPGFGAVKSGSLELSNVNLSSEFSDLVIMQRGYQASSQVISTANEMLQELFNMKNK